LILTYYADFYLYISFFFSCYALHRDLHSLPTRRSSDLPGLWRVDADGRNAVQLVTGEVNWPVVTRDDRHVIFASSRGGRQSLWTDRKSTRLNSSHVAISYAVFCLKKKKKKKKTNNI